MLGWVRLWLGWAVTIFVLPAESETRHLNWAIFKNLLVSNGRPRNNVKI